MIEILGLVKALIVALLVMMLTVWPLSHRAMAAATRSV